MSLLKARYLQRFNELIVEGESLNETQFQSGGYNIWVNHSKYFEWLHKTISLLENVLPVGSQHWSTLTKLRDTGNRLGDYECSLSFLKAIKDDYENGFLDTLARQIEANLTCDYVELAEGLMNEADSGSQSHIPAAVLAGAVLERSLRSLCERQTPPIETKKANGDNKTMTPLIEDLQKAGVFNKPQMAQYQSYAHIRNHAAHGEFDKFDRAQVEGMIAGVNKFLADFMG